MGGGSKFDRVYGSDWLGVLEADSEFRKGPGREEKEVKLITSMQAPPA